MGPIRTEVPVAEPRQTGVVEIGVCTEIIPITYPDVAISIFFFPQKVVSRGFFIEKPSLGQTPKRRNSLYFISSTRCLWPLGRQRSPFTHTSSVHFSAVALPRDCPDTDTRFNIIVSIVMYEQLCKDSSSCQVCRCNSTEILYHPGTREMVYSQ